ncbi:unnamed protein product [Closterium sp. NIES-65]|nr:unnamed protein product [Closterium sp. NIES-65]
MTGDWMREGDHENEERGVGRTHGDGETGDWCDRERGGGESLMYKGKARGEGRWEAAGAGAAAAAGEAEAGDAGAAGVAGEAGAAGDARGRKEGEGSVGRGEARTSKAVHGEVAEEQRPACPLLTPLIAMLIPPTPLTPPTPLRPLTPSRPLNPPVTARARAHREEMPAAWVMIIRGRALSVVMLTVRPLLLLRPRMLAIPAAVAVGAGGLILPRASVVVEGGGRRMRGQQDWQEGGSDGCGGEGGNASREERGEGGQRGRESIGGVEGCDWPMVVCAMASKRLLQHAVQTPSLRLIIPPNRLSSLFWFLSHTPSLTSLSLHFPSPPLFLPCHLQRALAPSVLSLSSLHLSCSSAPSPPLPRTSSPRFPTPSPSPPPNALSPTHSPSPAELRDGRGGRGERGGVLGRVERTRWAGGEGGEQELVQGVGRVLEEEKEVEGEQEQTEEEEQGVSWGVMAWLGAYPCLRHLSLEGSAWTWHVPGLHMPTSHPPRMPDTPFSCPTPPSMSHHSSPLPPPPFFPCLTSLHLSNVRYDWPLFSLLHRLSPQLTCLSLTHAMEQCSLPIPLSSSSPPHSPSSSSSFSSSLTSSFNSSFSSLSPTFPHHLSITLHLPLAHTIRFHFTAASRLSFLLLASPRLSTLSIVGGGCPVTVLNTPHLHSLVAGCIDLSLPHLLSVRHLYLLVEPNALLLRQPTRVLPGGYAGIAALGWLARVAGTVEILVARRVIGQLECGTWDSLRSMAVKCISSRRQHHHPTPPFALSALHRQQPLSLTGATTAGNSSTAASFGSGLRGVFAAGATAAGGGQDVPMTQGRMGDTLNDLHHPLPPYNPPALFSLSEIDSSSEPSLLPLPVGTGLLGFFCCLLGAPCSRASLHALLLHCPLMRSLHVWVPAAAETWQWDVRSGWLDEGRSDEEWDGVGDGGKETEESDDERIDEERGGDGEGTEERNREVSGKQEECAWEEVRVGEKVLNLPLHMPVNNHPGGDGTLGDNVY